MKITVINWNDIIPNMTNVFTVYRHPTEIYLTDALLISDDTSFMGSKACKIAREKGIPSFIVQHGRGAASDYTIQKKEIIADFFLAWGFEDVEQAVDGGWPRNRVKRIGCPALVDKCTPEPDGKTVVFAPIHHESGDGVDDRNGKEGMAVCEILQNMDGVSLIAKLLKDEHSLKYYPYEKFLTRRGDEGHIKNIYEGLLKKTSCVVSQVEGTFELLAYSMDIPVVRLSTNYPAPSPYTAKIVYDVDGIEEAVREALTYPEINREMRRVEVINRGGLEADNPRESIIRLIKEFHANKR